MPIEAALNVVISSRFHFAGSLLDHTMHLRVLKVPSRSAFRAIISRNTKYVARSYILSEVDAISIIMFIVEHICVCIVSKF